MFRAITLVLLVLLACRTANSQDIVQGDRGIAIDRALANATYGQFRGCILASLDGKIVIAKGYGLARRGYPEPITADSLLELASVSKAFTAAAILRLEAQGKLSTDDPISKHLANVPDDKKSVTIHNLLTHTSGIGYPTQEFPSDDREAVVKVLLAAAVDNPPGTVHAYSNAGYWLLAAIIERVSGRSYEEFVREEVLRPAGMTSSGCQTDPALDLSRCVDRVEDGRPIGSAGVCPYPFTWGYRGSGGVCVCARDMFAWDQALRADALLPAAERAKMFTPFLNNYAYGWEISEGASGRIASHTGGVAGFVVSFTRYLDRDACILVITNPPNDPIALGKTLLGILLPETVEHIRVTMRPGMCTLNEWGGGALPPTTTVRAQPTDDNGGVVLRFLSPGGDPAGLDVSLSESAAVRVSKQLAALADELLANSVTTPLPPVLAEIYTMPYRDQGDPILVEGDGVALNVIHGTLDPEEGSDLRISLIVMDTPNSFSPVNVKLGAIQAKDLASAIIKATGR